MASENLSEEMRIQTQMMKRTNYSVFCLIILLTIILQNHVPSAFSRDVALPAFFDFGPKINVKQGWLAASKSQIFNKKNINKLLVMQQK